MVCVCHTHVLALLSHYFESVACVYSVIFSPQRRCTGCRVFFSDPRCFVPVTVYGTTHAHLVHVLATVVGPLPNGLQFCHVRYIHPSGVTQVDHDSAQLSRLEAVVVASPKSPESLDITPMASQPQTPAGCLLASVEGTTVRLEIPKGRRVKPKDRRVKPKDRRVKPKDRRVKPKDRRVIPKDRRVKPKNRRVLFRR